jgi:ABC-2 type transport system ATP-binding protein
MQQLNCEVQRSLNLKMSTIIRFDHVSCEFGGFKAVNDVSFSINQGEIVGLLGHNGAGKTTIIKLLTGYLVPTQGQIIVDGLHVDRDLSAVQSRIGYLPENCPLWPDMPVIEFLLFQASLKAIPKSEVNDRISYALQKTNLIDKAMQPIGTLSKGYRQRVGVANAIINQPKIIILDEPTNGLDPVQIIDMRELIQELAQSSTIIISTHILQEVQAVCDHVKIIRAGRIVTDSSLDDLNQIKGLRVTVNQNEKVVKELFSDVEEVNSIQLMSADSNQYQYLFDIRTTLSACVSQKIFEAGYRLIEITPERNDLETLFKDDYVIQKNKGDQIRDVA